VVWDRPDARQYEIKADSQQGSAFFFDNFASMVELADTPVSKAGALGRVGSTPTRSTNYAELAELVYALL
jgi:hypothetical protein